MLHASKHALFDDSQRMKLESPEMTLNAWTSYISERQCQFQVERVQVGKNLVRGKKFAFKISTKDPLWNDIKPALRSKNDIVMLMQQLEKRFPDSVVPKLQKSEVDNLHLMKTYLTKLSVSPFFRMDVSYIDFVNGGKKDFKQTKKNDRKHSQGTLRWLQQTTEFKEFDVNEDSLKLIKQDLDSYKRTIEGLLKALAINKKVLLELQMSTNVLSSALGEMLNAEQTCDNRGVKTISGLPEGAVKERIEHLIDLHQDHGNCLEQSYDGDSLERLTTNELLVALREVQAFYKLLSIASQAMNDYEKTKAQFETIPNENPSKAAAKESLTQKDIFYFKCRRALGYELERFRIFKTVKIDEIFKNISRFHLRGASAISQVWAGSGVSLTEKSEQEFQAEDSFYKAQDVATGSKNTNTLSKNKRGSNKIRSLQVTKSFVPKLMSAKFIKITKGELLTGFKLDNDNWQVTNSKGTKGLVKDAHVSVTSSNGAKRSSVYNTSAMNVSFQGNQMQNTSNFSLPPQQSVNAIAQQRTPPKGDVEGEDWSLSGDSDNGGGGKETFGAARPKGNKKRPARKKTAPPKRPVAPMAPPGLTSSFNAGSPQKAQVAPIIPVATAVAPEIQMPTFNPPPSSSQNTTTSAGFGQPQASNGNAMGQPIMPTMPSFGANPMGGSSKPPQSSLKPASIAPTTTIAAKQKSSKMTKKKTLKQSKKEKKKKTKASAVAAPKTLASKKAHPMMGGGKPGGAPSFLADIAKGQQKKVLNRVPDADKSKEIGGGKGLSAVDKGKGKKAPVSAVGGGGGGGMMGEMAAFFKKKQGA